MGFNLSEQQSTMEDDDKNLTYWYREDKVKEFVKLVKDTYWYLGDCKICKAEQVPVNHDSDCVNCVIDKLAGGRLNGI